MKIIITETKFDELKQDLLDKVKAYGIKDAASWIGMDINDFIGRFGFELDDDRIEELIDFYMENKFHKVYDFKKKLGMCDLYETPSQFLTVVTEAINEFCYNNFNFSSDYPIDEEDMEFENLFYQMEYYIHKNYAELIKDTFIKNCGI